MSEWLEENERTTIDYALHVPWFYLGVKDYSKDVTLACIEAEQEVEVEISTFF